MRKFFIFLFCIFLLSSFAFASGSSDPSEPSETIETDPVIESEELSRNVSPVTPNDANGLKKVMLQLIGDYETVVTEYRYTNNNGYTSVSVSTEPDYSWLCSCAIFFLVIYSCFRLLGGVICGKRP